MKNHGVLKQEHVHSEVVILYNLHLVHYGFSYLQEEELRYTKVV